TNRTTQRDERDEYLRHRRSERRGHRLKALPARTQRKPPASAPRNAPFAPVWGDGWPRYRPLRWRLARAVCAAQLAKLGGTACSPTPQWVWGFLFYSGSGRGITSIRRREGVTP